MLKHTGKEDPTGRDARLDPKRQQVKLAAKTPKGRIFKIRAKEPPRVGAATPPPILYIW